MMDEAIAQKSREISLNKTIDGLRAKVGQMAEEANAQNETIAQLRATIQQQTKEVNV
jgi:outer membrane murein-binding lipoprotein Lpp